MKYATIWCSVQEEGDNKTVTAMTHPYVYNLTREELLNLTISLPAPVRTVTEEELQGLMESAPAVVSTTIW
jgi:hypothetical protein